MNSVNESLPSAHEKENRIQRLSNFLFNPRSTGLDITEQRKARLSAILSFVLTLTNGISILFILREGFDATFYIQVGLIALTFIAYLLSRSPRSAWGSMLLVFTLSFSGFANLISGSNDPLGALYTTIPVAYVIGSALLPVRVNVTHYIITTVGITILPFIHTPFTFEEVGTGLAVTFTIGFLAIVVQVFRNNVERARLEEIQTINQQLRDLGTTLEQRVADRTRDLATVAEVGTATATIMETDRLLQTVVNLTKERFNLYHSHIYLLDEAGENLVLAAGAGEPGRQMVGQGFSIPLDREQSLVARAARERKGITVNDVTQAPDFLPNPLLPDTRSELAVPMIVAGSVIGVFDIQSDQIGRFTDTDISIQTTLAAQIGTSIQNVRSFEQTRKQAEFETLVNLISQRIQRTTSIEDTLQTAVRELGTALGATRVVSSVATPRAGDALTRGS